IEAGIKEEQDAGGGKLWSESSDKMERTLMKDMDHEIIGGRIARRWGLDPRLQEVIRGHHAVRRNSSALAKLVALADLAANTTVTYPIREENHPLPRLMERLKQAVGDVQEPESRRAAVDDAFPSLEEILTEVLAGLEVPDSLWKIVDRDTFFKMCFHAGPRVRSATTSFLQMTATSGR
ncbi:MAG: hypothetical protein KC591_08585, partial [Gemmatimonadetes bacterium]|nr:hypothetical protein [Gemmatimonadota bacterium]